VNLSGEAHRERNKSRPKSGTHPNLCQNLQNQQDEVNFWVVNLVSGYSKRKNKYGLKIKDPMPKPTIFWREYGPALGLGVALTAMLGSLYYSEIAGFVPCTLCWYQRILMYPLTLIILVGLLKQDEDLPIYVLPFSIGGIGVSTYHYLTQLGLIAHSGVCAVGIPCNLRYVNYFGFVTIPFMALTAFSLISVIMVVSRQAYAHQESE
jgi:disulfide bond formation protein DsbB